MQPVLMIGCGGSGTKAVRHVRAAVKRRLLEIGWEDDLPSCWRFVGIDTPSVQEASSEIPPLPHGDYLAIGTRHKSYPALCNALFATWASGNQQEMALVGGWLPDPSKASFPLSKGAGQTRAIGRAAALDAFPRSVVEPLQMAFRDIRGSRAELDSVTRALGYEISGDREASSQDPLVVVCTSIGGGTGAGISLDVIDMVRAIDISGSHPVLVLFANDIFDIDTKDALAANSLAFLSEMMAAYWSENNEILNPMRIVRTSQTPGAGPHSVFLLSREQHGGASFGSTSEVYLAAGEVLSTWVVSEVVQEQIVNFLIANWQNNASLNYGGYPFGQNSQQAVISSFGVSQVSVGRDRFARWTEHKLARSVMDSLLQGHLKRRANKNSHLTDEDWAKELGLQHAQAVYKASGVNKQPTESMATIEEFFADDQKVREHRQQAAQELTNSIPPGNSLSVTALLDHLKNRAARIKNDFDSESYVDEERHWRTMMAANTAKAVAEVAAVTSIPVVMEAVDEVKRNTIKNKRSTLLDQAGQAANDYKHHVETGLTVLKNLSGNIAADSVELKESIENLSLGLAQGWRSRRLAEAAELLAHAESEVLEEIMVCLISAQSDVSRCLQDEQVAKWPQADEPGISTKYHPTAVEFPLEGHEGWNAQLRALCKEASEANIPYGDLHIDPVRYRMIAGYKDDILPMVYIKEGQPWNTGIAAPLGVAAGIEDWVERFRGWANKPGSHYRRFISEGLGDYLAPNDKYTGQRRPDHNERLASFRENMLAAKERSKPMMRLSSEVYHLTHDKFPDERFFQQTFPFKDGHPAADIVHEVMGTEGWRPSLLDMTSVMLTSYFESPVHPMTVSSLTEPIAAALNNFQDGDKRAHSFWQWRRARRLDAFIPLPRVLLERMIRGFAIARLCGLITVSTTEPVVIMDPDTGETHAFPWPHLTRPSVRSDILAVLLENLSLCIGLVNTEGLDTFNAYKMLHDLGEVAELSLESSVLSRSLQNGVDTSIVVDTPVIQGSTEEDRTSAAERYLEIQESQFQKHLDALSSEIKLRDRSGVAQRGVPTGELAEVYLPVYRQLKASIRDTYLDDVV